MSNPLPTNPSEGPKPIIEIVTVASANDALDVPEGPISSTRGRHLIVHSDTLSKIVRDVVQIYPGYPIPPSLPPVLGIPATDKLMY